jgi:glucose/arabinose dehydrogenase
MRSKGIIVAAAGVVASLIGISAALAAEGPPPPPKAVSGALVEVVASGIPTPTAIAFGKGNVFVAGYGDPEGKTPGGIFVLRGGKAVKLPGLPGAAGLAWKSGTLYATTAQTSGQAPQLVAWSGWNGSTFTKKRVVWSGPKRFPGLNGLAIGWDGRIYAGVGLTDDGDIAKSKRPYAQSVISLRIDGTDVRTVATGLRQPWQVAFVKGAPRPYVTVLGQENLGKKQPPDYVIVARDGEDYGFPACNWSKPKACASFAKPVALFPAHSSPTGLGVSGSSLYVALFNGTGRGPEVVTLPSSGGNWKRFLTGFPAPVVALGVSGNHLYAGDLTGSIYRVEI